MISPGPSKSIAGPYLVPASKEGRGPEARSTPVPLEMDQEMVAVYKIYNDADELIYIGVSSRPVRRMLQHLDDKRWNHEIAKIDVLWLEDRAAALNAERFFIIMDDPKYNIVHKPTRPFEPPTEERPCSRCGCKAMIVGFKISPNGPVDVESWCDRCNHQWRDPR